MNRDTSPQESEGAVISLVDIWNIIKTKWIFILAFTILCGIIGFLFTRSQSPTYSSGSVYMVYAGSTAPDTDVSDGSTIVSALSATQISMSKAYKGLYLQEIGKSSDLPLATRLWLIAKYGYSNSGESGAAAPSASSIRNMIKTATEEEDYFLFTVKITASSPEIAADVNQALSEVISGTYKSDPAYGLLYLAATNGELQVAVPATGTFEEKTALVEEMLAAEISRIAGSNVNVKKSMTALVQKRILDDLNASRNEIITLKAVSGENSEAVILRENEALKQIAASLTQIKADTSALAGRIPADASSVLSAMQYTCAFVGDSTIYSRDVARTASKNAVSQTIFYLSVLGGLCLSILFFVVLKLFDTKIRTEEDLRSVCSCPILSTVPAMHTNTHPR